MPLKKPFTTHLGNVKEREAIIVAVRDADGRTGYGEVVAFSAPWYTEETVKTSYHMLKDFLIPLLKKETIAHPREAYPLFERLRKNHMAKAGLEMALWDLQAKKEGRPLAALVGGVKKNVPAGVVVAAKTTAETLRQIETYLEEGYERVKVKIRPDNDYALLSEIRRHFPTVPLIADANAAYTREDVAQLKKLDEFQLLMIEQPLAYDDIVEHMELQKQLATPICLDESIGSVRDAKTAIALGCRVINVKLGRIGGWTAALAIHELAKDRDVALWCGGMIEFGISRAHNIALASLETFSIPGDLSSSSRFWDEDLITPEVTVTSGYIAVPTRVGIGFSLNEKRLQDVLTHKERFLFT